MLGLFNNKCIKESVTIKTYKRNNKKLAETLPGIKSYTYDTSETFNSE